MSTRLLLRPVIATMAVGLILVGVARLGANQLKPQVGQDSFVPLDLPTAEDIRQMRLQMEERNWGDQKEGHFTNHCMSFSTYPVSSNPRSRKSKTSICSIQHRSSASLSSRMPTRFVVEKMHDPRAHIVNLILNEKAISVTYCNLQDCVRVVTQ